MKFRSKRSIKIRNVSLRLIYTLGIPELYFTWDDHYKYTCLSFLSYIIQVFLQMLAVVQ
ncbi:hypothetical protein BD408DRAFT_410289 [Parasitella parasitica]|nr:hypothetical protein BD408DRAFT_410289 [Parasitella parasitica]